MRGLPSGTVTLLCTDIEGSTRLLQVLGDRYGEVLAQHRELLRAAFHAHNGHEVDTQGDAFLVAFARATQAVACAIDAQKALATHPWPAAVLPSASGALTGVLPSASGALTGVQVRMGIHTGEPMLTTEGYAGLDVHRVARITAAGHGGQVLLSGLAARLVQSDLPERVALRDLAQHRLKDILEPEHLYQLVIPGLAADFAPLRTNDGRPNNLPLQRTPLLGREREIADVANLLREGSGGLITLSGPGGTGKTRLGLAVAAEPARLPPRREHGGAVGSGAGEDVRNASTSSGASRTFRGDGQG